jgi:hypothetical protein
MQMFIRKCESMKSKEECTNQEETRLCLKMHWNTVVAVSFQREKRSEAGIPKSQVL